MNATCPRCGGRYRITRLVHSSPWEPPDRFPSPVAPGTENIIHCATDPAHDVDDLVLLGRIRCEMAWDGSPLAVV